MKKIYLIQHNVQNEIVNNRIKALGAWTKYFSDNWLVESDLSAKEIYNKISEGFEQQSIFIVEVDLNNYWGRMNTKVWDFIRNHKGRKK
ncbi:hypothetical protein [Flavobacterium sp.]|uniref:hypothetical protein n=1 Tax=Flavobacterium sp. TaxID=239 RepID=UPI00261D616E|nr:hypothetical protein [Flavobacterium sp.]